MGKLIKLTHFHTRVFRFFNSFLKFMTVDRNATACWKSLTHLSSYSRTKPLLS